MPPNYDDLERAFERDGFVNAGSVLHPSEAALLAEELERHIDTVFRGRDHGIQRPPYAMDLGKKPGQSHYQLCGMWKVSEPFRRLIENPKLVEIAARLAHAKTLQVWIDTVQYKPPQQGAAFHWHQDAPYHISIDPATKLLGAWITFDDADPESGCMWMVPGSHRWGDQERHLWGYHQVSDLPEFADVTPPPDAAIEKAFRGAVACPARAGEVHFHNALTWHGSPTNRSGKPRRAYTIHFMPEGMRVSERFDTRLPFPSGTPMTEVGPDFPIVYRAPP